MKGYHLLTAAALLLFHLNGMVVYSQDDTQNVTGSGSSVSPGTDIPVPENTSSLELTARWGVRVNILDENGTMLDSIVTEVQDDMSGTVSLPVPPDKDGYVFSGWNYSGTDEGSVSFSEDGLTAYVNGPGPVVISAEYSEVNTGTASEESAGVQQNSASNVSPVPSSPWTGKRPELLPPTEVFSDIF